MAIHMYRIAVPTARIRAATLDQKLGSDGTKMQRDQKPRIEALRDALQDEVHGLWISNEMAIKILARIDNVRSPPSKLTSDSQATIDPHAEE
jgi:hypothetical protein